MNKKLLFSLMVGMFSAITYVGTTPGDDEESQQDYQIMLEQSSIAQGVLKGFEEQKTSVIEKCKEEFSSSKDLLTKKVKSEKARNGVAQDLEAACRKTELRITQEYLQQEAKIKAYLLEIIDLMNNFEEKIDKHANRALENVADQYGYTEDLYAQVKKEMPKPEVFIEVKKSTPAGEEMEEVGVPSEEDVTEEDTEDATLEPEESEVAVTEVTEEPVVEEKNDTEASAAEKVPVVPVAW